jgi:type IV pilus assembly protein PilE
MKVAAVATGRAPASVERLRGVTLIELMIVVAIVAILALVAYPSYTRYVVKANRAEAQSFLMDVAQRQQQFIMSERRYAPDPNALGVAAPERVSNHYTIDFETTSNPPPPTFRITATPLAGTIQVDDGTMSIDQSGEKLRAGQPW